MKIFVGTDIIEIERIKKSCQSRRFCERVYSEKELTLFSQKKNPYESMAANWAAKESFGKALSTGVEGFGLNEVSCLRDENGCPYLELTGNALRIAKERGLTFSVSLSHIKDIATAVVIAYKTDSEV
ncbi:holo-ACP synthase [Ruminococcus sp.]|uniref:holo-ACP synthase n=1 Tax=Ruminococcus sp. TaxID=41978 RepID=UPI0025F51CCB|nr:holo-ACP synthase [Ruminococcus sp.]